MADWVAFIRHWLGATRELRAMYGMQLEPPAHRPPGADDRLTATPTVEGDPCRHCTKETIEAWLFDCTAELFDREEAKFEHALDRAEEFASFVLAHRGSTTAGPFVRVCLHTCLGCGRFTVIIRRFVHAVLGLDFREDPSRRLEAEAPSGLAEALERALEPNPPLSARAPAPVAESDALLLDKGTCGRCGGANSRVLLYRRIGEDPVRPDQELEHACQMGARSIAALVDRHAGNYIFKEPHRVVLLVLCRQCVQHEGGWVVARHRTPSLLNWSDRQDIKEIYRVSPVDAADLDHRYGEQPVA